MKSETFFGFSLSGVNIFRLCRHGWLYESMLVANIKMIPNIKTTYWENYKISWLMLAIFGFMNYKTYFP